MIVEHQVTVKVEAAERTESHRVEQSYMATVNGSHDKLITFM